MSGDWLLGIESTAPRGSLVLMCGDEEVAAADFEASPNHSAVLSGGLAGILQALPPGSALTEVVVATGPGSYNGARVGIAAGQGVALVHGCATVGIPSLEAVPEVRAGRAALAVGDARRGSSFAVPLMEGRLAGEVALFPAAELGSRVEAALAAEQWVFSLEDPVRLSLAGDLASTVHFAVPEARFAVASWRARSSGEQGRLREIPPQPFYLRPPHITKAKARRPSS